MVKSGMGILKRLFEKAQEITQPGEMDQKLDKWNSNPGLVIVVRSIIFTPTVTTLTFRQ